MKSRKSIRLPCYDYTSNGAYFITICTHNREHSLGEIIDHEMNFSRIGEIVSEKWFDIPNHHEIVELGEYILMPNHIHGIIWIVGTRSGVSNFVAPEEQENAGSYASVTYERDRVCQGKPRHIKIDKRVFGKPHSGSLSMIVNQFKGSVKRWCNQNDFKWFRWQRNYYEHVIRNEYELIKISDYIKNNPQKWSEDEYI